MKRISNKICSVSLQTNKTEKNIRKTGWPLVSWTKGLENIFQIRSVSFNKDLAMRIVRANFIPHDLTGHQGERWVKTWWAIIAQHQIDHNVFPQNFLAMNIIAVTGIYVILFWTETHFFSSPLLTKALIIKKKVNKLF